MQRVAQGAGVRKDHDHGGGLDGLRGTRRVQRQERQARVGILRNPNRVPGPPAHRPPLIGKWLPLRSSRRPPEMGEEAVPCWDPAPADDESRSSVLEGDNGEIRRIDLAWLMESVEGLGQKRPARVGIADHIVDAAPPPARPAEDARLAEAMREPEAELGAADPAPPPDPGRLRGLLSRLFGTSAAS